jgi:hypothetical protein
MIDNMDWSIFWDAASAIGTVFVGLVAVGITIWQTHLQYHSKADINVCLSTLVGFQADGTEIVEKPITATITNIGNSPMTITHVSICYKDKGKQEVSILNNPVKETLINSVYRMRRWVFRLTQAKTAGILVVF